MTERKHANKTVSCIKHSAQSAVCAHGAAAELRRVNTAQLRLPFYHSNASILLLGVVLSSASGRL